MIVETTVRLKVSECGEPVRLTLANGAVIVLVIEDDRGQWGVSSLELAKEAAGRKLKKRGRPTKLNGQGFSCGRCEISPFPTKRALGAHNRYQHPKNGKRQTRGWSPHNPGEAYHCRPCDLDFDTLKSLNDHQEDEHGVKQHAARYNG